MEQKYTKWNKIIHLVEQIPSVRETSFIVNKEQMSDF